MTFRYLLFFAFIIFIANGRLNAQTFELTMTQRISCGDSLIVDLFIQRTSNPSFDLGSSNFVVNVDTSIVDLSQKSILIKGIWTGVNAFPNNIDKYLPMQVGGNSTFFNVTVTKNPGVQGNTGIAVPLTKTLIARVFLRLKNCSAVNKLTWRKNQGVITNFNFVFIKNLATFVNPPNSTFAFATTGANSYCSEADSVTIGANCIGNWRLISNIGSTFINGLINANNTQQVSVNFGKTIGIAQIDTLEFTNSSGCKFKSALTVQPPPAAGIVGQSLVSAGSQNIPYQALPGGSVSYDWSIKGTGSVISTPTNLKNISVNFSNSFLPDTLFLKVTNTVSGCIGYDTLIVNRNICNAFAGPIANDTTICTGKKSVVYLYNFVGDSIIWQAASSPNGAFVSQLAGIGDSSQVFYTDFINDTTYFRAIVKSNGCADTSLVTMVAPVDPSIAGFIQGPALVCKDSVAVLILKNSTGSVKWQQSVNGFVNWTDVTTGSGFNTDTLTTAPLTQKIYYRARLFGGCDSVFTDPFEIDIVLPPLGSFDAPPPPVCCDSLSVPLGATATVGTGYWTTNGNGTFVPNILTPNAQYKATNDCAKTITLSWVVLNGTCDPVAYFQNIDVTLPPLGSFDTPVDTICTGGCTAPLAAIVTVGVGTWSTTNGCGTFSDIHDPNAEYCTCLGDGNKSINLTWSVASGTCDGVSYTQNVFVRPEQVIGSFSTQPANVCINSISQPLGASVTAPSTGKWTTNGSFGYDFIGGDTNPNAQYQPGFNDGGKFIDLTWTVNNGDCPPLVITKQIRVNNLPKGSIAGSFAPICQGDSIIATGVALIGTGVWVVQGGSGTLIDLGQNKIKYKSSPTEQSTVNFYWILSNGACVGDTIKKTLIISAPPDGDFTTALPEICAGTPTVPLNASLFNGTGTWSCFNCDAASNFSNASDPNAYYVSSPADTNKSVGLVWTVCSQGCGCVADTQYVFVNNLVIDPILPGIVPDLCVGESTPPLGAANTTGIAHWETDNGAGTFLPSPLDPNAVYQTSPLDAEKDISLKWVIQLGNCNAFQFSLPFRVSAKPVGDFPVQPTPFCFVPGAPSDTIRASATIGTGIWKHDGTGAFTCETCPNTTYIPNFGDVGADVNLCWIVTNGTCDPDTNCQLLTIIPPPAGNFTTNLQPICAGGKTPPLNANVIIGAGHWTSTSPLGSFDDALDPNTLFKSDVSDSGTVVTLYWIVENGSCTPDTNVRKVAVLNSKVDGGVLKPDTITICDGKQTCELNGFATFGTGIWTSSCPGVFSGPQTDPNVCFTPFMPSGGQCKLFWTITNGICNALVFEKTLIVNPKPSGDILTKPQAICVGECSDSLFGLATVGEGRWTCQNCLGSFANPLNPKTVYCSNAADANKTIKLIWRVGKAGCDSVDYSVDMFVYALPAASITTNLPAICAGDLSVPICATVTSGTGFWSCVNCGGGFTNTNDPCAKYISVKDDGGKIVQLVWNAVNGPCDTLKVSKNISINAISEAKFSTVLPIICEGETGIPLGAVAVSGVGKWSVQGGNGTFSNVNSGNSTFTPAPGSADSAIFICWSVTNGNCPPDVICRNQKIAPPSKGGFTSAPPNTCACEKTPPLTAFAVEGNGVWSDGNGTGTFDDKFNSNTQYRTNCNDIGKTITLTWTVGNGLCDSVSYSHSFLVTGSPNAKITVPTTDEVTVCYGDTLTLTAAGGVSYLWDADIPDDLLTNGVASIKFLPQITQFAYVDIKDSDNCTRHDSVLVIVNEAEPIVANSDNTFPICTGKPVTLSVTVGTGSLTNIQWKPSAGLTSPNSASTIASPTETTTYTVTARTSATGCVAIDSVTVEVIEFLPPTLLSADYCQGDSSYLVAINNGQCDFFEWYDTSIVEVIKFPAGSTNPYYKGSGDFVLVDSDVPRKWIYSLRCINSSTVGCDSYSEDSFNIVARPRADFVADRTRAPFSDRTINFTDQSQNATKLLWYFGDPNSGAINLDTIKNPSHTYSSSGIYTVILVASNETCPGDIMIKDAYIMILQENFLFPTAFTPNGDGLNDLFRPLPADGSARMQIMEIYDQWNKLIFSTSDNNGWNGRTTDGKPFDPGLYSYRVLIDQNPDGIKVYTGVISLIR